MRVSKDKDDSAYDARERKVFISEKPVENWISADEFRRVIVLADGKAIFGDVYIERLPELKIEIDVDHIINADKVVLDGLTIKNEPVNFGVSENKAEEAENVPAIAETPKQGYSVSDRVRFRNSK